jgi:hypothetical protein
LKADRLRAQFGFERSAVPAPISALVMDPSMTNRNLPGVTVLVRMIFRAIRAISRVNVGCLLAIAIIGIVHGNSRSVAGGIKTGDATPSPVSTLCAYLTVHTGQSAS